MRFTTRPVRTSLLSGIARSFKPGGVYVGVDISGSSTLANNLDDPIAAFQVHLVGDVLHDGFPRLRRNGSGRRVGRGARPEDDERSRLPFGADRASTG